MTIKNNDQEKRIVKIIENNNLLKLVFLEPFEQKEILFEKLDSEKLVIEELREN